MMHVTFPHQVRYAGLPVFWLAGQSLETQESISGAETITPTSRARWMATLSLTLHDEGSVLEWQAFLAQMQGRIGTTDVPALTRYRPSDLQGRRLSQFDKGHVENGQTFEHFGFENSPTIRMRLKADAALRTTRIDLDVLGTTGLRPGQFFGIADRLHRVQSHWQPDATRHRIQFEPPLRKAWAASSVVEIARPVCRMRFASDTEGLFDGSLGLFQTVTCNFVEAV